jgi:NADH dehydrogenase FAD-containing subunit
MSSEIVGKNIVIVGGGYAGYESFTGLSKKKLKDTNVILVSKSDFFFHNVATPRTLVQSSIISDICIPFNKIIKEKHQKFIHGINKNYFLVYSV